MRQKSNKIKGKRLKTAKTNQNCFIDVAELFVEHYRYIAVESKEQTIYLIIQKSTMKETARNTTSLLDITKQTIPHSLITQVTAPGAGDGGGRRAAGGAAGCRSEHAFHIPPPRRLSVFRRSSPAPGAVTVRLQKDKKVVLFGKSLIVLSGHLRYADSNVIYPGKCMKII